MVLFEAQVHILLASPKGGMISFASFLYISSGAPACVAIAKTVHIYGMCSIQKNLSIRSLLSDLFNNIMIM